MKRLQGGASNRKSKKRMPLRGTPYMSHAISHTKAIFASFDRFCIWLMVIQGWGWLEVVSERTTVFVRIYCVTRNGLAIFSLIVQTLCWSFSMWLNMNYNKIIVIVNILFLCIVVIFKGFFLDQWIVICLFTNHICIET